TVADDATSVPATVSISITQVAPTISTSTLTANESGTGSKGVVQNTLLSASDPGITNPADFLYTVTAAPLHGHLVLDNGGGPVTLTVNSTFTQADVNAGDITYTPL